jgi:hypothetical protein
MAAVYPCFLLKRPSAAAPDDTSARVPAGGGQRRRPHQLTEQSRQLSGADFLLQRVAHEQIVSFGSLEPIIDCRLRFLFEDCGHAFYSLVGICSFYRSSFDAIAQVISHFNG